MKRTHDKKTLANEYCLCRDIPHRWDSGNLGQLIIGEQGKWRNLIYSIYNIPYSEIIPTIDSMCEYSESGFYTGLKLKQDLIRLG